MTLNTKVTVFNKTNREVFVILNDPTGVLHRHTLDAWSGDPNKIPQCSTEDWWGLTPSDVSGTINYDTSQFYNKNDSLTFNAGNPKIGYPWIQFDNQDEIRFDEGESKDVTYLSTLEDGTVHSHNLTLKRGNDTSSAKDMQIILTDHF